MKPEELQIGDWVYYKGNPIMVFEIDEPEHNINTEQDGYNAIRCISIDEIQPIPLTPEILEKNGFMEYRYRQGDWFFVIENKENETLAIVSYDTSHRLEIESWDDFIGSFERGGIKYIHQLQQAIRLCGTNKEIIVEDKK